MMYDYLIYCLHDSSTLSFAYISLRECLLHGQGSHFQEFSKKKKKIYPLFSVKYFKKVLSFFRKAKR